MLGRQAAAAGRAPRLLSLAGGDVDAVVGEHVTQALADGDAGAAEVMAGFCRWVALGLANLAAIFDPEIFVIGGGLIEIGDPLLGPVRTALDELVLGGPARPRTAVVFAALGERAGAMGAASL
jgi:glucokinase